MLEPLPFGCVRLQSVMIVAIAGGGFQPRSDEPGPESDTVFVSGLGEDVDKQKIAEFFGQIGLIKVGLV